MSLSKDSSLSKTPYTAGLKIKDSECHEHLTIFFAKEGLQSIDLTLPWNELPKKLMISGECFVGPNNDIPVWCVRFLKEEKVGISLIHTLFERYNVPEDENPSTRFFFPHITKKKGSKLKLGDVVEVESFFIKELGPHDPFFVVKL